MKKLLIIGLDCATPQLVFDAWLDDLPNIKKLVDQGIHGNLKSTCPPITVPAWTSMMTSKDPGTLGFYGFRNRKGYGYDELFFANNAYVKEKRVWNYLSRKRKKSLIMGVPQTYPPKPLNGMLVASFLTPNKDVQYTHPDSVKTELDQAAGGNYIIDVRDFRTDKKEWLIEQIYEMTEARFKAFNHFYKNDDWDFAMMVEMGIDRIHHAFWRYHDKNHRLYEAGNKFENAIFDYYKYVDARIGETLALVDPEETTVMVVSDHGAKTMTGAIAINEWFMREGYLTLKEPVTSPCKLATSMIDWSKTRCWGEGGYYSRVFFNVKDREPEGIIPKEEYDAFRREVITKLEAIEDEEGKCIGTQAFKPEDIYSNTNGIPPDLVVYLGNLDWRSAGSVGLNTLHIYENDTGPDDANHAENGIIIWNIDPTRIKELKETYSIYDMAPTILTYFGMEVPEDMIGQSLI